MLEECKVLDGAFTKIAGRYVKFSLCCLKAGVCCAVSMYKILELLFIVKHPRICKINSHIVLQGVS